MFNILAIDQSISAFAHPVFSIYTDRNNFEILLGRQFFDRLCGHINWANTSLFTISGTLPSWKATIYTGGYFSDVILVSNYHGCKGEAIKLIPFPMIDIIYKHCEAITYEKVTNHTKYK